MTGDAAWMLGPAMTAIDPWARLRVDAAVMSRFLANHEDGARRYRMTIEDTDVGTCVVRVPWLFGPYLNILGVLPALQRQGVGQAILKWLEIQAPSDKHRNL